MLKKTLNKHTREFLETNLPENFFLFKKSNKKRKKIFNFKAEFIKTHLSKLSKASIYSEFKRNIIKYDLPYTRNTITTNIKQNFFNLDPLNRICKKNISGFFLSAKQESSGTFQKDALYQNNVSSEVLSTKKFLFSLNMIKSQFEKRQTRVSDFKNKLKEKKKLSILYGNLSNKSIKKAVNKARMLSGNIGENLLSILESRVDIILYRSLFFPSIKSAKQWIKCNKILVNSFCINVSSYNIKYGDIISIPKKGRKYIASNMLKHFINYNIIDTSKQFFLKSGSQKLQTVFTGKKSHDKSAVIPTKLFTQDLSAKILNTQFRFFPEYNYGLISSIYKNINLLNKTFKQNLTLCRNMIYGNFLSTQYHAGTPASSQKLLLKTCYFFTCCAGICTGSNVAKNLYGKQSKILFSHMWKKNMLSNKRNINYADNFLHQNTFLENSICDTVNNKFRIFSQYTNHIHTKYLSNNSDRKLRDIVSMFTVKLQSAILTHAKKNLITKNNLFSYRHISDIILKNKLINICFAGKKKINLYNIFCKLNFYKFKINQINSTCVHMHQSITLSMKEKYITHCISGFVLKNFFILKNAFRKKHRYIISDMYMQTLVNQIKLTNTFLFKLVVDLLDKNYVLQDICNKQDYIKNNRKVAKNIHLDTCYLLNNDAIHINITETLKALSKKTKNLGTYKSTVIIKYKILLSKINNNFLIQIKNIFNSATNDNKIKKNLVAVNSKFHKNNVKNAYMSYIKYYDLLFFLKLKKKFLNLNNKPSYNESKYKIKPLNLEISYKTLTIIYLYKTQKLVLPCSLDIELLLRYDI